MEETWSIPDRHFNRQTNKEKNDPSPSYTREDIYEYTQMLKHLIQSLEPYGFASFFCN